MKIYNQQEFDLLELKDQVILSSLVGSHLMTSRDSNYRTKLYYLNNFYIEMWEDIIDCEIMYVRTFKGTRGLTPYLSHINITALY